MAIETNVAADLSAATIKPQVAKPAEVAAEARPTEDAKPESLQEVITAERLAKEQAKVEAEQLESEALSHEQLEVVVQQLQDFVQTLNRGITFTVDQDSGKDVITVANRDTGELVRQIPSEEVLQLAARLSEATGLLVNTEA